MHICDNKKDHEFEREKREGENGRVQREEKGNDVIIISKNFLKVSKYILRHGGDT